MRLPRFFSDSSFIFHKLLSRSLIEVLQKDEYTQPDVFVIICFRY
jgi:hypothetical protein